MRSVPTVAAGLVLLGAATLFAGPGDSPGELLPLGGGADLELAEVQLTAIEKGVSAQGDGEPCRQVRVHATFVRIDRASADEILGSHRPEADGSARTVPEALARRLLDLVQGAGPVRPEPLPPLVLRDGQGGRLSATGHHTYLRDYDVAIAGGGSFLDGAIVGRLTDGAGVVVLPHQVGESLQLDVDAAWAEVIRPVPLYTTTLEADPTSTRVTIELPEMRVFEVRQRVEIPAEGGYLLAGGGKAWDRHDLRLVVLEVRPMAL